MAGSLGSRGIEQSSTRGLGVPGKECRGYQHLGASMASVALHATLLLLTSAGPQTHSCLGDSSANR